MHPCLLLPEITAIILESLLCDESCRTENRKAIRNLALTCRALSEPALDVIWGTLHSLVPLIRVMPFHLWEVRAKPNPNYVYTGVDLWDPLEEDWIVNVYNFAEEPANEDWDRLLHYNHRIRTLEIKPNGVLHPEAFRILTNRCPGELLPNVRHISLGLGLPYITESIPLCSPHFLQNITHIETFEECFPKDASSVFQVISKYCPQIRCLNICGPRYSSTESNIEWILLSLMVQNLDQLEEIKLYTEANQALLPLPTQGSSSSVFEHLSSLKTLKTLSIDCTSIPDVVLEDIFSREENGFPNLTKLRLDIPTYDQAVMILRTRLLGHPSQSGLRELWITISDPDEGYCSGFSDFMALFAEFGSILKTLVELTLDLSGDLSAQDLQPPLGLHTCEAIQESLSNLWRCNQLEELTIRSALCSGLDNAWMKTAAPSWTALRRLQLQSCTSHPQATLEAYAYFVQSCPGITDLRIPAVWKPFDMKLLERNNGEGEVGAVDKAKNEEIAYLYVLGAARSLEQPEEVFRCVKTLFPNLKGLSGVPYEVNAWREFLNFFEVGPRAN